MQPRKTPGTPQDGDFASHLERQGASAPADTMPDRDPPGEEAQPREQNLQDVLVGGEGPTEDFLEKFRALQEAPEPDDEALERQALEAGGGDGDPRTPE